MSLSPTDSDVYTAIIAFIKMIVPANTPVIRGQQNRVPMPNVPCVVLTTIGVPRRIGTNADTITAEEWTADGAPIDATADGGPDDWTADGTGGAVAFISNSEADFEYSVQADFYSPDAESWAMSTELVWRSKGGWYAMPDGMKPLYSEGRQQLPIIAGEKQWIQRWTMTLVLDYKPVWTQATQAATTATVIPEPIDVFFPAFLEIFMKKLLLIFSLLAGAGGFADLALGQGYLPLSPIQFQPTGTAPTAGDCLKILAVGGNGVVSGDAGSPCGTGTATSVPASGITAGSIPVGANLTNLNQLPTQLPGTIVGNCSAASTVTPTAVAGVIGKAINITCPTYGASASSSDNQTAIQAAINAAITAGVPLYIPAGATCYKYTAPLTISGSLTIVGDYVAENWGPSGYSSASVPTGTPPLLGSVLCPSSNGSDAIDITGTAPVVNLSNFGILFQTPFVGTGHGISAIPPYTGATNEQGLSGSGWRNIKIYGHDGNHYAFNIQNLFYDHFASLNAYGGGGLSLTGTSYDGIEYGNSTFDSIYSEVIVGGSAHGYMLHAGQANALNLLAFIRPQTFVQTLSGITPGGNPPTTAQYDWNMDTAVSSLSHIKLIAPEFNTVTANPVQFTACGGCDYDLANGIIQSPQASGVIGASAVILGQNGGSAANATGGSIYIEPGAQGGSGGGNGVVTIEPQGLPGNAVLNLVASATGTSAQSELRFWQTGTLEWTIGMYNATPNQWYLLDSSSNTVFEAQNGSTLLIQPTAHNTTIGTSGATETLNGTVTLPNIASDTTHTDATVCEDTTSHSLYFGSGTLGICLGTSSARYKHDIIPLSVGLDVIEQLKPLSYMLNSDHGDPTKRLYGFTAEDMAPVVPNLVGLDSEGKPNTADYVGLIPVMVKAMQEQQREILDLKRQLKRHH